MLRARCRLFNTRPANLHGKGTHPRFFSYLVVLLSLLSLFLLAPAQVRPMIIFPPEPPPCIFAAPTGATKVTVYRDPSPSSYTTGYVVLWGTTQGGPYPNSSPELPSTQRQYTVQGLQQDQTYSFVVKAVFRGTGVIYSDPSEEDSAVLHVGAIPWDTQDVNQIIPAVRNVLGAFQGERRVFFSSCWAGGTSKQPRGGWAARFTATKLWTVDSILEGQRGKK